MIFQLFEDMDEELPGITTTALQSRLEAAQVCT
jgi:hypothetical protein